MRKHTLIILFIALVATHAIAADLCVDPTGGGDGTSWGNCLTWSSFTPVRGNTYYLADGTYGAKTLNTVASGSTYIYIKKATASAHGPAAGWESGYGDGVAVFNGTLTISTDYWEIDGVTGGGPGAWTTGHGFEFSAVACVGGSASLISLPGANNVSIKRSKFYEVGDTEACPGCNSNGPGKTAISASATSTNNTYIGYCYITNMGGLAFYFRYADGLIIEYNYMDTLGGASVCDGDYHTEALVSDNTDNVHFRFNYVGDCPSSGGYVKNASGVSSDVRIYGNIFANGFPIQCNTGTCLDWKVFNNTFYNFSGGPFGGDGTRTNLLFYNNISFNSSSWSYTGLYSWISDSPTGPCSTYATETSNITVRRPYNCDTYTETYDPFIDSTSTTPEQLALSAPITSGVVSLNNSWSTAAGGWIGYDVCLLDACTGEKKYNIDMLGNTRGADGVWDRGAIEYGSTTPTPPTIPGGVTISGGTVK